MGAGAMRIRRPMRAGTRLRAELLAGLLLHDAPWPKSALLIGLGPVR